MVVPMSVSWHSLKLPYFFSPAFTASMQPGFGWQEEMNTRLSSTSSRSTRRSVMYFAHADGQAAAVFFDYLQFAVDHFQCGLDAQQVCPEGQHTGAAAALGHKVQPIQYKAQLYPFGKALQPHRNVAGVRPSAAHLAAFSTR